MVEPDEPDEHVSVDDIGEDAQPLPTAESEEAASKFGEQFKRDFEQERHDEELTRLKEDREARKGYAQKVYVLICCWLAALLLIILLAGFGVCGFDMSTAALTTLIGTTTANVLGLFFIVLRYLFPQQ